LSTHLSEQTLVSYNLAQVTGIHDTFIVYSLLEASLNVVLCPALFWMQFIIVTVITIVYVISFFYMLLSVMLYSLSVRTFPFLFFFSYFGICIPIVSLLLYVIVMRFFSLFWVVPNLTMLTILYIDAVTWCTGEWQAT